MKFEDLDPDSLLARALAPYVGTGAKVDVVPTIGVDFVEPWVVYL